MSEYLNDTRVEFDFRLKLCILNMPKELKCELLSENPESLEDTQVRLREYFVNHQNEFNIAGRLKHSYECCPDFYALLIATVSDLSKCETWEDVFNQINIDEQVKDGMGNQVLYKLCEYEDDYDIDIKNICICSHTCKPENVSIITNPFTK
jgi:hypothetical protein